MITDYLTIPHIGGAITFMISMLSLHRFARRDWEKKIKTMQKDWYFNHHQLQKDVKHCQKDLHDLSINQAELRSDVKHIKTTLQNVDRKLDKLGRR